MLKKRNLFFLSLLILGILLLTSCFLKPPVTEGILKGQVMVPEGSVQTKDLTGQALPDATVNIIDLTTGEIIATTTTDSDGHYQVFVPPGGPYLLEAVKDGVKLEQITPPVEVGIEYDLGTADCTTTAVALIVQAMLDAGVDLADINLADIESDPDFDDVLSSVTSIIEAGGDPTASAAIEEAVEDFLNPPASPPSPPALSSAKEVISYKFEAAKNAALTSDVFGTVDSGSHTIALTVPCLTTLTALVATFELSTSATAEVGSTAQVSGTTANDFTSPVTYTVTAEDGSTQDFIVTVTVAPGPFSYFTITGYPSSTIAGAAFASNVVVTAYDIFDKIKTDYTGEVYFTSTDSAAILPYISGSKYTFTVGDNGIHTFPGTGFTLKTAGSQTISVTDGVISKTSSAISVIAGAANAFLVTTQNSGTETAGTAFNVTITAKDSSGNTATSYTGPHAVAWTWDATNSPSGTAPTKPPDGDQTFSDGGVTVTGFTLYNSSEKPTITVTASSISSSTPTITVNAGSLSYVKIEDKAGGTGSEVDTHSMMTTPDNFIVYAAGYDEYGNYKKDESVTWIGTGICLDKLSPTSGISTTFTPTGAGTGTITADHATVTDDTTGTITVSVPPPVHNITQDTYYNTIQAALNEADTNNTIKVADGTYTESITFPTDKVITLQSVHGALSTIIQGNNGSATITLDSCLTGIILEGFTITHASGETGRGMYISNSNLTINNCEIRLNNLPGASGVGIWLFGTLTINSSTISQNTGSYGAGINFAGGTLTINHSNISENTSSQYGGGICTHSGKLTITGFSTISANIARYGGGIYYSDEYSGSVSNIINSNISYNNVTVTDGGGGIYVGLGELHIGGEIDNGVNFNTFMDNSENGNISPTEHIRSNLGGDLHISIYPYNNYFPYN